jgi:hypothetical protein
MDFFQTLLELNEQFEVRQREYRLVESTLNQIRGQLLDQEHKRGVMFCTTSKHASVLDQDIPTLVQSIERCIQELDLDVEIKKEKLKEVSITNRDDRISGTIICFQLCMFNRK